MKTYKLLPKTKSLLLDTVTPVSIYLKFRDKFEDCVLLESSDYQASHNSHTFIGLQPIATFKVENNSIIEEFPDKSETITPITEAINVPEALNNFIQCFNIDTTNNKAANNGLFGYTAFDGIKYFESIELDKDKNNPEKAIPELRYSIYRFVITINHFNNDVVILENLIKDQESELHKVETLLFSNYIPTFEFSTEGEETSNLTDQGYRDLVSLGKQHCFRGDVFQIVLSRMFQQQFKGDDFNVYRALRSINPSPYLFYFDYGGYRLFGSSPEAQILIKNHKATINPIAGTFKRTGNDEADRILAKQLALDPKENAEHVMLVDLARNDLSRNCDQVVVENYREVQYYSHVLHLVSKVTGQLPNDANIIKVMADSFPAGTLSGAPKFKAMELINQYENQNRSYYGGCIGTIDFNGDINQAIMIRSFLSKDNNLFYQAGAGIVAASVEESELQEVNNKLGALKKAIEIAKTL